MADEPTETSAPVAAKRNLWARLRSINKGQLALIGIGVGTLIVGLLAYRAMSGNAKSGDSALPGSPGTDNPTAGGGAGFDIKALISALRTNVGENPVPTFTGAPVLSSTSNPKAVYTQPATSSPSPPTTTKPKTTATVIPNPTSGFTAYTPGSSGGYTPPPQPPTTVAPAPGGAGLFVP